MAASRRSAFVGLVGALILLTACMGLLIAQAIQSAPQRVEIDHTAPAIDVRDSSGRIVSLAELRGRVAVLFFSSSHCPVSADYAERVAALSRRYSSDNVIFLRVTTRIDENSAGFIDNKLRDLAMRTMDDSDGALAARYNVRCTPTFYVIGTNGQLRYSGAFDDNRDASKVKIEYCRDAVQSLITGEAVATTSTSAFGCAVFQR